MTLAPAPDQPAVTTRTAARRAGGEPLALVWTCGPTAPGACASPAEARALVSEWLPAAVPGTAALALRAAGRFSLDDRRDFDAEDWWFVAAFDIDADTDGIDGYGLRAEGLATLAEVWVNDQPVLVSEDMFIAHEVTLDGLRPGRNELAIRFGALAPRLAVPRRPRPRWKATLVKDQGLRWIRTTLIGRSPGWTPDVAPVGPWRPVSISRPGGVRLDRSRLRAELVADDQPGGGGAVEAAFTLRGVAPDVEAHLVVGDAAMRLDVTVDGNAISAAGRLAVPGAEPWWPATHGAPALLPARLELLDGQGATTIELGRVGFRSTDLSPAEAPVLRWNGTEVFARGVCWSPLDIVSLQSDPATARAVLTTLRDAGVNMIRVQGSYVPETDDVLDACDELGIMVWHDLPFASLDLPADDPAFTAAVRVEVGQLLDRLGAHPSTAVVCGGTEAFQQRAMMGLPADIGGRELYDGLLAELCAERLAGVPYWPNSPAWTGEGFAVDSGVAHYFGVGGYRRPLSDARTSQVRFTTECLGFSNVPGDETLAELVAGGSGVDTPQWKAGVPRDRGAAWDFEDVRDHYTRELLGVDPVALRGTEPARYLDLGQAAMALVLHQTLLTWRRADSGCGGALVLESSDLRPGAGFGLLDASHRPKPALHALARAMQPVAIAITDEGLNGLHIHLFNDRPEPLAGNLTVEAFAGTRCIATGTVPCDLGGRSGDRLNAEGVLGSFLDITWSYRFGPRTVDAVSARWDLADGREFTAVHLIAPEAHLGQEAGLGAALRPLDDGTAALDITTEHAALCVLVSAPGAVVSDDAFDLPPGGRKTVLLRSDGPIEASVRAANAPQAVEAVIADA